MNKSELTIKCREILYKYDLHQNISPEDLEFLANLLNNHPGKNLKIGPGIKNIYVDIDIYKKRGFILERIDGSWTDFSFYECISPKTKINKIKTACRYSIMNDILDIKNGVKKDAHHSGVSFNKIFSLWIENKNIDNIELGGDEDHCQYIYFKDENLAKDFIEFHNKIATIELLDEHIHRHIKRKTEDNNGKGN